MHTPSAYVLTFGIPKLLLAVLLVCSFQYSHAEMEELDDQKLEEHTAQEGITIDLSYKVSIGQVAWKFSDDDFDKRKNQTLSPPPPRIEYVTGNNQK